MKDINVSLEDINILPPDTEWFLAPVSFIKTNPDFKELVKCGSHIFYIKSFVCNKINITEKEYPYNIVIGNVSPRIDCQAVQDLKIKGNFILLRIYRDRLLLLSDHLGIKKFFYTMDEGFLAGSNLDIILYYIKDKEQDKISSMLYILFNYFVWGRTIFKKIHYSEPSTLISIENGIVTKSAYYRVNDNTNKDYTIREKVELIAEFWDLLIKKYTDKDPHEIVLTLTGGYDSRMILAGILNKGLNISTFTFGNPKSQDALNAKNLAKKLNLMHYCYPLDSDVTDNLVKLSEQLVTTTGGLLNILRIIRVFYFRKASELKELYLGYGGSEIIRGSYPDGLLTSSFLLKYFKGEFHLVDVIIEHLNKYRFVYNESDLNELVSLITAKLTNYKPINHLFEVVIPLHFGEDVRWLEMYGIKCRTPYLDIDFIEMLSRINGISLLRPAEMNVKESNLSRIDNPKISASVISKLSKELATFPMGKGYSPKDYLLSKYFAGIKLIVNKYLVKKELVTIYQPWYPQMLNKILSDEKITVEGFDKGKLLIDLPGEVRLSEVDFLPFTKFFNLYLINKIFNGEAVR